MLEINITLLIQIIHFYIAYLIITAFLLKPAYEFILKEDEQKETLLSSIGRQKEHINQIQWDMYEYWTASQNFFKQQAPEARQSQLYIFRNIAPDREMPIVENNQIAQKVIELSHAITSEIDHVRV